MATMLSQKLVEAQEANDTVRDFMRRFVVGKLLSSCRAQKTKGFSVFHRNQANCISSYCSDCPSEGYEEKTHMSPP